MMHILIECFIVVNVLLAICTKIFRRMMRQEMSLHLIIANGVEAICGKRNKNNKLFHVEHTTKKEER